MIRGVLARAAALAVVFPFLTLTSTLAPEHIHEPGPGRNHGHAVAHSHFAPHHAETHGGEDIEIEHDDADHGRIVWLDSSILSESPFHPHPAALTVPAGYEIVQIALGWSVTPFDAAAPVHGPPKSSALFRGPPRRALRP